MRMTQAQHLAARRRAIHAAARQLGLDEDARRDLLQGVTGQRSTKSLDLDQCRQVLDHMRRAGARRPAPTAKGRRPNNVDADNRAGAYKSKIEALLTDMGLSWAYADAIARHMWGADALQWVLDGDKLHAITVALIKEQEKRGLLGALDVALAASGRTRAEVEAWAHATRPRVADWTRNAPTLKAALVAFGAPEQGR